MNLPNKHNGDSGQLSRTCFCHHLLLAAGVLIRTAFIASDDLWYDEAFTYVVSRLPWSRFWPAILGDVHPPGWYLVTRPFVLSEVSPWMARAPAALASIATLILFWWWIQQITDDKTALVGLALMALAPVQMRYAAEARMYAALELAGLMMIVGITLKRPGWLAAGIGLAPWLQHMGWLFVGLGLAIWIIQERNVPRPLWIGLTIASGALAFCAYHFLVNMVAGYWMHDRSFGAYIYHALFAQFFLQNITPEFLALHVAVVGITIPLIGLLSIRRYPALAAIAWLPGLAIWIISQWRPLLVSRILLPGSPAMYFLSASAITRLVRSDRTLALVSLAVLPIVGGSIFNFGSGHARNPVQELYHVAAETCSTVTYTEPSGWVLSLVYAPDLDGVVWDRWTNGVNGGGLGALTEQALGMRRVSFDESDCWVFVDHALIGDGNRNEMLQASAGRDPDFVLLDDELIGVALYRR